MPQMLRQILLGILIFYDWILIIYIVLGWLLAFGVITPRKPFVVVLGTLLNRLLLPILMPLRRRIPPIGGMDLSVVVLFLIIFILRWLLR